jgi:thiamine kinase-like enzyme
VCHSDLHVLNLVDHDSSTLLLDWEYAHVTDPFWDLAGWSANNDFEGESTHDLLASYTLRTPAPQEYRRLELLKWLYDYVCLLWCGVAAQDATAQDATAQDVIVQRAGTLAARLHATSSSRAD